jgi:hypothetical protein
MLTLTAGTTPWPGRSKHDKALPQGQAKRAEPAEPHAAPQAYTERENESAKPENESAKPEHPHDEPPGQAKKA